MATKRQKEKREAHIKSLSAKSAAIQYDVDFIDGDGVKIRSREFLSEAGIRVRRTTYEKDNMWTMDNQVLNPDLANKVAEQSNYWLVNREEHIASVMRHTTNSLRQLRYKHSPEELKDAYWLSYHNYNRIKGYPALQKTLRALTNEIRLFNKYIVPQLQFSLGGK